MHLVGSEIIPATQDVVWRALNTPEIWQACITGCESVVWTGPAALAAKVVVRLGPFKVPFHGVIHLSDIKAPESYRLSGQGQGGLAGAASASALVRLSAQGAMATRLDYDAQVEIGGSLAKFGDAVITATAQKLAGKFFARFSDVIVKQQAAQA